MSDVTVRIEKCCFPARVSCAPPQTDGRNGESQSCGVEQAFNLKSTTQTQTPKKATMGIPEGLSGADQAKDEVNPDPLAATSENVTQTADAYTSENNDVDTLSKRTYSPQELQKVISQRQVVDMSDEDMDPIEWTVRKVFPIPAEYYWDVVSEEQHDQVPTRTKVWHKTISFLCGAHQWTERSVAKPLAASLGLTDSRFDYVVDNMTDEEWEKSRAMTAARRSQGKKEELQSKQDVEVGTTEVSTTSS
jgi:hypothetical protein